MKSTDLLNQCAAVQSERGKQYDANQTGERSFQAAAEAFNALTGQSLKGSDVCLMLVCVKAVRQYSDPIRVHDDSVLDLVSYASLWGEELHSELGASIERQAERDDYDAVEQELKEHEK